MRAFCIWRIISLEETRKTPVFVFGLMLKSGSASCSTELGTALLAKALIRRHILFSGSLPGKISHEAAGEFLETPWLTFIEDAMPHCRWYYWPMATKFLLYTSKFCMTREHLSAVDKTPLATKILALSPLLLRAWSGGALDGQYTLACDVSRSVRSSERGRCPQIVDANQMVIVRGLWAQYPNLWLLCGHILG